MFKAKFKIFNIFLSQNEFDKIIFEKRNKDYGAYDLRKNFNKNKFYSLLVSVIIYVAVCMSFLIYENFKFEKREFYDLNTYYIDDNYNDIPYEEYLPEPPISGSKSDVKQSFEITKDDIKEIDKKDLNSTGNDTTNKNNGSGNLNGDGNGSTSTFVVKHSYAEFPGGNKMIERYLRENVKYPKEALSKGIGGVVIVSFCINKYGNVTEPSVTKSVNFLLDAEALRVVKAMPRWNPAYKNDVAVDSWFKLPINFIPSNTKQL